MWKKKGLRLRGLKKLAKKLHREWRSKVWEKRRRKQKRKPQKEPRKQETQEEVREPEIQEERRGPEPYTVHMKVDYTAKKHHNLDYEVWVCIEANSEEEAMREGIDIIHMGIAMFGLPIIDPIYGVEYGGEPGYGELILRGEVRMRWNGKRWM